MLLNLYKKKWNDSFKLKKASVLAKSNQEKMKHLADLSKSYAKWIDEEMQKTPEEFAVSKVGKIDPKRHLTDNVNDLIKDNVLQTFGMTLAAKAF